MVEAENGNAALARLARETPGGPENVRQSMQPSGDFAGPCRAWFTDLGVFWELPSLKRLVCKPEPILH